MLVRRCMRIRRIVRAARAVVMRQYRTAQDCSRAGACCTYEPLACMRATSYRIAGMWVYIIQGYVCRRTPYSACLQVYAIQRSVCGHVPYIALVCRCIPYRTEICLQAYTVQCLFAGLCNTALCLRACTVHRACLQVYAVQSHFCRCMRISRTARAARAVVMHQYHTAQDCRKAGACCTYEPLACMRTTSYRIAGMWVYII